MPEKQCQGLLVLILAALGSSTCKDSAVAYMWRHIHVI